MNVVRRPHSIIGEIAWHGAPNPFTLLTSPSGSRALHPIAVCISPCLAATSVAGVMEKNERRKNSIGRGAESGKQSSKKKIRAGEKDEWRFQGYKA